MDQMLNRRIAAVKAADAINAIEGVSVSDYAKTLSACWARGEITDQQMKAALLASHRKLAEALDDRARPCPQLKEPQDDKSARECPHADFYISELGTV